MAPLSAAPEVSLKAACDAKLTVVSPFMATLSSASAVSFNAASDALFPVVSPFMATVFQPAWNLPDL
jgi:hypothetical protein